MTSDCVSLHCQIKGLSGQLGRGTLHGRERGLRRTRHTDYIEPRIVNRPHFVRDTGIWNAGCRMPRRRSGRLVQRVVSNRDRDRADLSVAVGGYRTDSRGSRQRAARADDRPFAARAARVLHTCAGATPTNQSESRTLEKTNETSHAPRPPEARKLPRPRRRGTRTPCPPWTWSTPDRLPCLLARRILPPAHVHAQLAPPYPSRSTTPPATAT
jgi:hypothetical protein